MSGSDTQSGPGSSLASVVLGLLALVASIALCPLLVLPLPWKEQAIFGAVVIAIAAILNRISRSLTITMLLMSFSVFSTLRYGYWRVIQTWEGVTSAGHIHRWDTAFVLLLLAAEFFAFCTLVLGYFQTLRPLHRPPLPLEGDPKEWPTVDVLVPTYNEPLHVVMGTVLAAKEMDYPADKMRVLLLDDGKRQEFREFAERAGVEYITRDNNAHAKAGNINHALKLLNGEFVAIFDSDHVPGRSFLQTTLGWFLRDRDLALVQTPHHFYSPDPFERNLGQFRKVPNEGELFHRLVQDGNDLWNASFFCGSCAVLRRTALDEIGGIAVETVTEDAHTALRMQRNGWNTAYINIPKAAGLATESLAAHIGQRIRWARGMTQILRRENPLFASGLSFSQRLCYFNATTHFLFAVPRLVFLTVPLVYLLFGKVNIYGYTWAVLAYAAPHLVLATMTNSRVQGRHRFSFWNEIYEVVLAPYILFPTLLALINPKLGKFNVTSKGGILRRSYFDRRIAFPYLFLLALNVAGIAMGVNRFLTDPAHHDTIAMNAAWALYNTLILSVAISVAWERRKLRSGACLRASVPAMLRLEGIPAFESMGDVDGKTMQLSRNCASVKIDEALELPRGVPVVLTLGEGRLKCDVAALVAHSSGKYQHLFFPDLSHEEEERIADLVRSRRKAWRALHATQPGDRPLLSLFQIFWLGVRGLMILPIGLLLPRPADDEEPDLLSSARKSRAASILLPALILTGVLIPRATAASEAQAGNRTLSATQPQQAQTQQTQAAGFHDEIDLGSAAETKVLSLEGNGASLNFFFDEPVTKVTTDAILNLNYAAPALRPGQARLEFTLNGAKIGSIAAIPGSGQHARLALPTDLLISDNVLSVELRGSCASCVPKGTPWVIFDPGSTMALDGTRLPIGNDLALLPLPFFDPAGSRSWSLPVVFGGQPDATTLESAALVASRFGVLSDVRGVHFPVSVDQLPNGNAVVFAVRGSSVLDGIVLPPGRGPLLAMRDNPRDPYGKLLIVTGNNSDDLLEAARTLATASWFPHVDSIRAQAGAVPSPGEYAAPRWLRADGPAPIGTYTTASHLKLQGTGSIDLYLRLAPDLFLRARQSVPLILKYQYSGAPANAEPSLNVRLNGQNIDSVRLQPTTGSIEGSTLFRLPTGSLRPYINTLTVDFYFGNNAAAPNARPTFAVDRNSSIDLRGLPHSVVLPRLELFANAGYPFTEWPDGSRTAVIMPASPSPTEYESLLDMTGFFGAQTGALTTGLQVTDADHLDEAQRKDIVLIGTRDSQPLISQWSGDMPLEISGQEMDVNQAPESTLLMNPAWPFREYDSSKLQSLIDGTENNIGLFVEGFISPLHADRTVVAIVPGGSDPIDAIRALFTPSERQGPVYGGVAISQNGRFESFLVGTEAYHAGDFDRYQYAAVLLFENYRLIPLILLVLSLLVVAWLRLSTERVAKRRLAALAPNRG